MRVYIFIFIGSLVYCAHPDIVTALGKTIGTTVFISTLYFLFSGIVNLLKKLGA